MDIKYLIDTDVLIDYLKGKSKEKALFAFLFKKEITVSVVTVAEYLHGAFRVQNPQKHINIFSDFIDQNNINILDIDLGIARRYGFIQTNLDKMGLRGGAFDTLIAAACLEYKLTLVTNNRKDFEKINGLKILRAREF